MSFWPFWTARGARPEVPGAPSNTESCFNTQSTLSPLYANDRTSSLYQNYTDQLPGAVGDGITGAETATPGAEIPQNSEVARAHIKSIRRFKLVGNIADLDGALEVLSNHLYLKPLRFVVELLQNADDNNYAVGSVPQLVITYQAGVLRFDNNEVGFTDKDVDAICGIGHSTKNASAGQRRRIGEKGIGFKSVFRVAEEVFITSGHYSFMFSSKTPLGRLVPAWTDFPAVRLPGHTSILLHLSHAWDLNLLMKELNGLDARLLMFLQKMSTVQVLIEENSIVSRVVLRREIEETGQECLQRLFVQPDKFSPYLRFNYAVTGLPPDKRRKGQHQSEIILAFPSNVAFFSERLKLEGPASEDSHFVYAFLPIRDFGFSFVLQADFVLIANREDIESESAWNQVLRYHIPYAICAAVMRFIENEETRYSWPRYIPFRDDVYGSDFFANVGTVTMRLLSENRILESVYGSLEIPSKLMIVPHALSDKIGRPLIPQEESGFVYLSPKYHLEAWPALQLLGVKVMSDEQFLDNLTDFILNDPEKFQSMSKEWHARICGILDQFYGQYEARISQLDVIPLRDGNWINQRRSQNGVLLLPHSSPDLIVPKQANIYEIHPCVLGDATRTGFLRKLQAQDTDTDRICQVILKTHASESFRPETIEMASLVSQVTFLMDANWRVPRHYQNVWVVTRDGAIRRSMQVYLASERPHSASQISSIVVPSPKFCFLHEMYAEKSSELASVIQNKQWLQENLGIEQLPRMATMTSPHLAESTFESDLLPRGEILLQRSMSFDIHKDFLFLMENCPVRSLQLLRLHWRHYQPWIMAVDNEQPDLDQSQADLTAARAQLRFLISSMMVSCIGGAQTMLKDTFLPRRTVLAGIGILEPLSAIEANDTPASVNPGSRMSEDRANDMDIPECPPREGESLDSRIGLRHASVISEDTKAAFLLDVPNPEHVSWNFLDFFGVTVKVTARGLIARLKQLRDTSATVPAVCQLYDQIQGSLHECHDEVGYVRSAFARENLIFIPPMANEGVNHSTWIRSGECVWDGPVCLRRVPRLIKHYPLHGLLFSSTLSISNATLRTLVTECRQLVSSDTLDHICQVFISLNQLASQAFMSEIGTSGLDELPHCPIFPVLAGNHRETFTLRSVSGPQESDSWYIADTPYLFDSFLGHVPLLAFQHIHLQQMSWLVEYLFGSLKLSKRATKTSDVRGLGQIDKKYTLFLRRKARFISSLVPTAKYDRNEILRRLHGVEVIRQESASTTWKLSSHTGETISGTPEECRVVLTSTSASLIVSIGTEDAEIGRPPLELVQELSSFCGIEKVQHVSLISHILIQKDNGRLERDLQRIGVIPDDFGATSINPDNGFANHAQTYATPMAVAKVNSEPLPEPYPPKTSREHSSSIATENNLLIDLDDEQPFDPYADLVPGLARRAGFGQKWSPRMPIERRVRLNARKRHGLLSLSMPIPLAEADGRADDMQFEGEFMISHFFQGLLKDDYSPLRHWTSHQRRRAGHKPYQTLNSNISTFTLQDVNGRLRRFFSKNGYEHSWSLPGNPTFHVQVAVSADTINSSFALSSGQVKMAKKFSLAENVNSTQTDMYVLILVYNLGNNMEFAIFPDPWQLHCNSSLKMETISDYECRFEDDSPAI